MTTTPTFLSLDRGLCPLPPPPKDVVVLCFNFSLFILLGKGFYLVFSTMIDQWNDCEDSPAA